MGKVLYTDFEDVESIISSWFDNPQMKKAVTKVNLYKFWDSILPEKYKNKSKPYSMLPRGVMVVACQNAIVAQELTLRKVMLLAKFSPYAKTLGINLSDFRFEPKHWVNETAT